MDPGAVSKHLNCAICFSVMRTPTRLHPCGHSFCKGCITEWLSKNKTCPLDRKRVKGTHLDILVHNIIMDQRVACPFRLTHGCTHVGPLEGLAAHKRVCECNPANLPSFLATTQTVSAAAEGGLAVAAVDGGGEDILAYDSCEDNPLPSPSVPSLKLRLFQAGGKHRRALCDMFSDENKAPKPNQTVYNGNVTGVDGDMNCARKHSSSSSRRRKSGNTRRRGGGGTYVSDGGGGGGGIPAARNARSHLGSLLTTISQSASDSGSSEGEGVVEATEMERMGAEGGRHEQEEQEQEIAIPSAAVAEAEAGAAAGVIELASSSLARPRRAAARAASQALANLASASSTTLQGHSPQPFVVAASDTTFSVQTTERVLGTEGEGERTRARHGRTRRTRAGPATTWACALCDTQNITTRTTCCWCSAPIPTAVDSPVLIVD